MKKLILIFALLFINLTVFSQTIRRVNNTVGLNDPSVYATAQAAHDAAKDGDIIQLEPSDNPNYGDLTVTKRLTILGIGYNLENTPNTFFDKRLPELTNIYFEYGSSKSVLMGVGNIANIYVGEENITISRCKVSSVFCESRYSSVKGVTGYGNKLTFTQNIVSNQMSGDGNYTSGSSCIISNNIFKGSGLGGFKQSIISKNTFKTLGNNASYIRYVTGCVISNNLIDAREEQIGYSFVEDGVTDTSISYNLCTTVQGLPTGGGNVNKANATAIFKVANPWENFIDSNLQLADKSPAKTVGAGSTAIGAYAGGNPYIPSGVPAGPAITSFMSSGFGSTTTPINITTSVRSNN